MTLTFSALEVMNMYFKECQPESAKMKNGFILIIKIAPCAWFTKGKNSLFNDTIYCLVKARFNLGANIEIIF